MVVLSSLLVPIAAILCFRFPDQLVPAIRWIVDYNHLLVRLAVGLSSLEVLAEGFIFV